MARIGVAIVKSTSFRGAQQEFSNVYHYEVPVDLAGGYQGIVDDIVTAEKNIHSIQVNFLTARVWSAGGSPAENETLLISDLSGTGVQAVQNTVDRERCILMQWPCERDSVTGRKVYLRKWYHICGQSSTDTDFTSDELGQLSSLRQTVRDAYVAAIETLRNVGPTIDDNWYLVSPSGRAALDQLMCHPYLEHHQLGEGWRG